MCMAAIHMAAMTASCKAPASAGLHWKRFLKIELLPYFA